MDSCSHTKFETAESSRFARDLEQKLSATSVLKSLKKYRRPVESNFVYLRMLEFASKKNS